jgi:hypothetical protein
MKSSSSSSSSFSSGVWAEPTNANDQNCYITLTSLTLHPLTLSDTSPDQILTYFPELEKVGKILMGGPLA